MAGAIDALHHVDPNALSDAELEALVLDVDTRKARLDAEHARLVAALDARRSWAADGSRSCAAWLARKRNGSRAAAGAALRLGRALRSMPVTDAALSNAEITVEHGRELANCARFAPEEFADAEGTLVGHARALQWRDFLIVCAAWRDAVNPDGADRRADKLRDSCHLAMHRRPDGSLMIQSGFLDPIGAEAFLSEILRLEHQLFEDDWAAAELELGRTPAVSELRRTRAQRLADALVEMAHRSRTAPADGRRPEPLVSVYVDYETVAGRLCQLASGVPITPGQLLPLFTRADIERVVFGPRNRVIELGVRERFFTGGLRRAIELRDHHCQFPDCDVPASECQVDHVIPYTDGGETTQENGRLACGAHNRSRTHTEWPSETELGQLDLDDDVGDDEPESDEEIEEQVRLCRARVRELARQRRRGHRPTARAPSS